MRLLTLLAAGVGTAELALQEGVPLRRMRDRIADLLARREAEPPAAFVPLHVARLGDAMKVAYAAMMDGDLKALDRVLRVGRELERYRALARPSLGSPPPAAPPRLAAPDPLPALPAPTRPPGDGKSASQAIEKIIPPKIGAPASRLQRKSAVDEMRAVPW